MSATGSKSQPHYSETAATPKLEIRLNWELSPWFPSVRENLTSILRREAAVAGISFRPGVFWKDVFVDQQLNWKSIVRSYAAHLIVAGLVYVASMPFYARRFTAIEAFHRDQITYINPNEDVLVSEPENTAPVPRRLAPIVSRSSRARVPTPGDAGQRAVEAIAIPKWSDNATHTIVAPTAPNILATAPIPDIVLSSPVPQAPPVAAVAFNPPTLVAPVLEVKPIAPPPDVSQARLHTPVLPQAAPIAPPVQINDSRNLANINIAPVPEAIRPEPKLPVVAGHTAPILGTVEPIAPAPDPKSAGRTQLAKEMPAAAEPIAPPPDVKAVSTANGIAGKLPGSADPVAPPPDLSAAGTTESASGSLISLNMIPVAGPPRQPDGQRRGAFSGHPDAAPDATGTPARQAGSHGPGGDSPVATKDELGIVAAAVPHGVVIGSLSTPGLTAGASAGSPNSLLAMARNSRLSLPPPRAVAIADEPNALDARVFRGRKYYTMALNTPNLTSAGGSWIFRFAERAATSKSGDVTAPIAVREVDPAYPADLIHDNIQGVVILYAIIRADGNVAEVKVLEGFDDRLDENARRALSAWHFVPGTRDGNPVDLEAVVRIPFRSKRPF